MGAARTGDRGAFQQLMERHGPRLHAFLLAYVPRDEVDDLLQEVLLAAWRGLPALQRPEAPSPWLFGIARNLARKAMARRAKAPHPLADPAAVPGSERMSGEELTPARLLAILQELPEAYRESLALRLVEGMGSAGIGAILGLTPASVRVNLSRGMKILRRRLAREGYP